MAYVLIASVFIGGITLDDQEYACLSSPDWIETPWVITYMLGTTQMAQVHSNTRKSLDLMSMLDDGQRDMIGSQKAVEFNKK